jgi:dTMP kinase
VVVTREPGATEFGARIRGMLLDGVGGPAAPSPRAEALLYAADRAHHVATVVRPALADGAVVISDRYVDSSLAYQGGGRSLPMDEIAWLSAWATRQLKPDLVVLLDIPPEAGLARVDGRTGGADRLEREDLAFHERVRHAFLDLAAADPRRYLVMDGTRSVDEIATEVLARVTPMLPPVTGAPPQPVRHAGSPGSGGSPGAAEPPGPRELSAMADAETGRRQ